MIASCGRRYLIGAGGIGSGFGDGSGAGGIGFPGGAGTGAGRIGWGSIGCFNPDKQHYAQPHYPVDLAEVPAASHHRGVSRVGFSL